MKFYKLGLTILFSFMLGACATNPPVPEEPEIAVKLKGTAIEVQHYLEERLRNSPSAGLEVDSATDREIVFKGNCVDTPNMSAFKCGALLYSMTGGGSGWDGPYAVLTLRTSEIRGIVNLTMSSKWCAMNAFGKTKCQNNSTAAERNDTLRKIETGYNSALKPS